MDKKENIKYLGIIEKLFDIENSNCIYIVNFIEIYIFIW